MSNIIPFFHENAISSPRARFFTETVLPGLNANTPVTIIDGAWDDHVLLPNGQRSTQKEILMNALAALDNNGDPVGPYHYVIVYDAATKKISFPGETGTSQDKRRAQSLFETRFHKFRSVHSISILSGQVPVEGELDPLEAMIDTRVTRPNGHGHADGIFFSLASQIASAADKPICIVVTNASDLVPAGDRQMTSSPESAHHPSRLAELCSQLQSRSNVHMILCDPLSRISGLERVASQCTRSTLPTNTREDVALIMRKRVDAVMPQDDVNYLAGLGRGLPLHTILEITGKHKSSREISEALIHARETHIKRTSGSVLTVSLTPITAEQISLTPAAEEYWRTLAHIARTRPSLVPKGILLAGPPGTGKSVAPKYLATLLGVPYFELNEIGTEGFRGRALEKAKQIFAIIEANKPCVVRIDEIDKIFPKIEGVDLRSNNDNEVIAYVQNMIADDERMRGVVFIGTTNYPENLDAAMRRSGRFGTVIAMLPPITPEEKYAHFQAVWHQIPVEEREGVQLPSESVMVRLLSMTPDYATGAIFKELIQDALRQFFSPGNTQNATAGILGIGSGQAYKKSFTAIIGLLIESFSRRFPRDLRWDDMLKVARACHNAYSLDDISVEMPSPEDIRLQAILALISEAAGEKQAVREAMSQLAVARAEHEIVLNFRQTDIEQMIATARIALIAESEVISAAQLALQTAQSEHSSEVARMQSEFDQRKAELESQVAAMEVEIGTRVETLTGEKLREVAQREEKITALLASVEASKMAMTSVQGDIQQGVDRVETLLEQITSLVSDKLTLDQKTRLEEAKKEAEMLAQEAVNAQQNTLSTACPDLAPYQQILDEAWGCYNDEVQKVMGQNPFTQASYLKNTWSRMFGGWTFEGKDINSMTARIDNLPKTFYEVFLNHSVPRTFHSPERRSITIVEITRGGNTAKVMSDIIDWKRSMEQKYAHIQHLADTPSSIKACGFVDSYRDISKYGCRLCVLHESLESIIEDAVEKRGFYEVNQGIQSFIPTLNAIKIHGVLYFPKDIFDFEKLLYWLNAKPRFISRKGGKSKSPISMTATFWEKRYASLEIRTEWTKEDTHHIDGRTDSSAMFSSAQLRDFFINMEDVMRMAFQKNHGRNFIFNYVVDAPSQILKEGNNISTLEIIHKKSGIKYLLSCIPDVGPFLMPEIPKGNCPQIPNNFGDITTEVADMLLDTL